MSKRDYKLFLEDMLEAVERIEEYTEGYSFEDFINDKKTIDAVVRNLEILGEAARNIPDEIRKNLKEKDLGGALNDTNCQATNRGRRD